jgi:MATE family multidrug resistance protein
MQSNLKQIWRLGLPISLTMVIQMIIVMVDSAFAGYISHIDLAAVSLAGGVFHIGLLLLIGIGIGASVKGGQASGADDEGAMLNCFRQGTLACLIIGLLLSLLLLNTSSLMLYLGQEPEVVKLAETYLNWLAWTLPMQALLVLFRSYFAVIDRPWQSFLPVCFALLLNTFLDYCLATGQLGFPALGISGIGIASLISNAFLIVMMLHRMGWSTSREMFSFTHSEVWHDHGMRKLLLISFPISLTLMIEQAFFSGSIFLAGTLGGSEQAAHQIILNAIGTSFLFNTGLAIACAILIGKAVGAGSFNRIMPIVKGGWVLAQVFTIPFALILLVFDDQWIGLFLDASLASNETAIGFVKSVLLIAIVMLFIDTIWLVVIESLHGLLDTTYPAISALAAYWLLGGPLAYWATQNYPNAFTWIWIAMLLAAMLLTILVYLRLRIKVANLSLLDDVMAKV